MDEISDIDVAKELIALCRAGKLYEIDRWIAGGRSLNISVEKKRRRQKAFSNSLSKPDSTAALS